MLIVLSVSMIFKNNLVEQGSEVVISLMGSGVDTDAGVGPLGTGEDGLLEREAELVFLVVELVPDVLGQVSAEGRLGSTGEVWVSLDVFGVLKVSSHHLSAWVSFNELA